MFVQANKSYKLSFGLSYENKLDTHLWYYIVIFALIGGLRWNVGADSYAYARGFKYPDYIMPLYLENKEYLWYALLWLHKTLGLHYVFGMTISAFLQIYFLVKVASKYKYLLLLLSIVLFGSHYFHDMMNGVRQMIAASIFFYATQEITNRKPVKYCLWIIIASLFHHSALMLIPLYLLTYIDYFCIKLMKSKWICIMILMLCLAIGQTPHFQNFMQYFDSIANLSGYDGYMNNLEMHLDRGLEETQVNVFGLMQLSYLGTALITIYYAPKVYAAFKEHIPHISLWLFLSFLYVCLSFLTQNLGITFIRPIMYLEYFHMFMIALVLYILKQSGNKYNKLFWVFCLIIWASRVWEIIKSVPYYPGDSCIYKLFLFHTIR